MPIPPTSGLHHITVMAGEPQQNLDFYCGVLGQRLVKRTVNFDDPATYHFYYGDEAGNPGPILTFFPWPGAGPGTVGSGETTAVGYWLAAGSVDHWLDRLGERGHAPEVAERLGDTVIAFADPDGLPLELIASADAPQVQPWANSPIPEAHRLRGFHSVTLKLAELSASAELLTGTLGYQLVAGEGERHRFRAAGDQLGPYLDALVVGEQPPGRLGVGSVHHVAFRAADDDHQAAFRERLGADGRHVTTVQERQYFRSIYFHEPGGVLFEIATDGPGFATDEALDELGLGLTLPPGSRPTGTTSRRLPRVVVPEYAGLLGSEAQL